MTTIPAPSPYVIEDNGTLRSLLKTHVVSLEHDVLNALHYRHMYRTMNHYTPPSIRGGVIFYRPGHELPVTDDDLQRAADAMLADAENLYDEWLALAEAASLPLDYMAYFTPDGLGLVIALGRTQGGRVYGKDFDLYYHRESHMIGQKLAKKVLRAYRARSIRRFEALGL